MEMIRKPAVAGLFYPDQALELKTMIARLLAAAHYSGPVPKALIAPHAGYIYSGPIAASAYASLAAARDGISRVVLLGPSHRVPFRGVATSSAAAYLTPLGKILLDRAAIASLSDLPCVSCLDVAHAQEHSLEVHLPFLQTVLSQFSLVPLVVGEANADEVSMVLQRLWGGPETLIVISSDLSHYHSYDTAKQRDSVTSQAIIDLQAEAIDYEDACGRRPIQGLLVAAREHGLKATLLDLRNSGDTAGPRDQVVGYGSYAFSP